MIDGETENPDSFESPEQTKGGSSLRGRLLWAVGGIGLFLLFVGLSAQYTSRPSFCTTCHYMQPYYDSWLAEPAHNDVTCVKCHFPPGLAGTVEGKLQGLVQVVNYLSSSYSKRKPWAEIQDQSCTQSGCHVTDSLGEASAFGLIQFKHDVHLKEIRGKNLRCTSCHSQIVQGEHIKVNEATCYLCHFRNDGGVVTVADTDSDRLSDCATCHVWDSTTVTSAGDIGVYHAQMVDRGIDCQQCHSKTVIGDGFVPDDNCFSCHNEPEKLDKKTDTPLIHEVHTERIKVECQQCHLRIQHKFERVDGEQGLECSTCHRNTHREQVMLFTGNVGIGERSPSPMFEAGLDCAGCHVFHEDLVSSDFEAIAQPQSCETCHGAGYNRLLQAWKNSANARLNEFANYIRSVDRSVSGQGAIAKGRAGPFIDQARRVLHVVQAGKPVHNVTFYDQLIRSGYEQLSLAAEAARVSVSLPQSRSTPVPGECANCHTGVETIISTFGDRSFSHQIHVSDQQLKCQSCHSSKVDHGQTVLTPESCNSCHHRASPKEVACQSCHEEAAEVYSGEFMGKDLPDYMFDEEIECIDCHVPDDHVVRPTSAVCLDCHDEGYDEDADEWKSEIAGLMQEVRALIARSRVEGVDRAGYEAVDRMLRRLDAGAAGGIHNYELTSDVLRDARKELRSALGDSDPPAPVPVPPPPRPQPDDPAGSAEAPARGADGAGPETAPDVLLVAEKMPELMGGMSALQSRIRYPERARRAGVEGRVIVQFIVDENGKTVDLRVVQGIGGGCDEEAVRALRESTFSPGLQRGVPVKVQMSLPVVFKLED